MARIAAMGRSIPEAAELLERQYDGTAGEAGLWDGLLPDDGLWDEPPYGIEEPPGPDPFAGRGRTGRDGGDAPGERIPFDADGLPWADPFDDDGWTIFDEEEDDPA